MMLESELSAIIARLSTYLVENIGCRFTASKMLRPLNVASASTVTQWCEWLEKAYLFFFVPIFSDSEKSRLLNPKKVYCIDTGLEYAVSSRRIPNDGARFENMVYLALRRRSRDISYFDADGECDFIVRNRHAVTDAIQACTRLTDEAMDREIEGLVEAMDACSLDSGTIITESQRDAISVGNRRIEVVPFYEWETSRTKGEKQ